MRILITGANGFLGYYLTRGLLQQSYSVIATGKGPCRIPFSGDQNFSYAQMDFTDPFNVHDVFESLHPEVVVHAGAMSKPDQCEEEQWQAYVTNVEGTLNVLSNAEELKAFFILVSTDFVFDGEKGHYVEDDLRQPVNFYGKTKLLSEEAVEEYPFDSAIVRTSLVFGVNPTGRDNLLTTIKKRLSKNESYQVFTDQVRTPTYVEDLANGIVSILVNRATSVFHISGKDILSPYEMACAAASFLKMDRDLVIPVTSNDIKQAAKRPHFTDLVIDKAVSQLNFRPRSFDEALALTLRD